MLLSYFVTVDIVTTSRIAASLDRSVYVVVDCKVIKMERLNKF